MLAMKIPFLKMHGLGNDMLLLDTQRHPLPAAFSLSPQLIRAIADRREGVGFDQLLVISDATDTSHIAHYRIFNSDGHEVEQCGNGARCIAAALAERDTIARGEKFRLSSPGGSVTASIVDDNNVQVDMGIPNFDPSAIPMLADAQSASYPIDIDDLHFDVAAVSIGNPHCVVFVDDIDSAPVAEHGALIGASDYFPEGVNVGFAQVCDRRHMRLRVFERGAGETRACGTGACAAMVCARHNDIMDDEAEISLPGGKLVINWRGPDSNILMTGPAILSFEGTLTL